jgi:hypothetical protein
MNYLVPIQYFGLTVSKYETLFDRARNLLIVCFILPCLQCIFIIHVACFIFSIHRIERFEVCCSFLLLSNRCFNLEYSSINEYFCFRPSTLLLLCP